MKKSRYRIVQYADNLYEPEEKVWFFWCSILNEHSSRCPTLESAKEVIEIYERSKQYPKVVYEEEI